MSEPSSILGLSLAVTGPIFMLLGLGVWLRQLGMLNDAFVNSGSEVVYKIALPSLLFVSVLKADIGETANLPLVGYGIAATVAIFVALEVLAVLLVHPVQDRGVVIQGAFRSNLGIVGLAYCVNAYGEAALAGASLYVGLLTVLFNILAVITLSRSLNRQQGIGQVLKRIGRNPMIIAIAAAMAISAGGATLPQVVMQTGQYLADLTLPFALLCTGASLNFRSLRLELRNTLLASGLKLVLVPLAYTAGAVALGFRGMDLGIIMLMGAAPSAAASYVMVRAMNDHGELAANIVALTSLGSVITTTAAITCLQGLELM